MSVIAARVTDKFIEVASDSIISKEELKRTNFTKLIQVNDMIFGGCGSAEELSIFLDFVKEVPTIQFPTTAKIRDLMLEFAKVKELYTGDAKVDNAYIIAIDGSLFEVDGMFVTQITDYTAIGQGESYALAALHLNHSVQEAVKVAADLCCFVAEPINYKYIRKN